MGTRRYQQRARAESAEQTRRRILDTVIEKLRHAPMEPISVEDVASAAGVARSTVYAIFGSRAGLFEAVGSEFYDRAGYERLLDAVRHPDAREHLRGGIRAASAMLAADRDVVRALFSIAEHDEHGVGRIVRGTESERARGMARLARRLEEQGELRPDLSVADAEHILWVLTSFESFDLLYRGRDLDAAAAAELLVATAERAVCT